MRLAFVAPSTAHPSGGVAVVFEMAAAMARRGHEVDLYHVNFLEGSVSTIEEIGWFTFPGGLNHHFVSTDMPEGGLASSPDVIFGFSLDRAMPERAGLPVVLIQGYKMLGDEIEHRAFRAPCPKVCVAGWLIDAGRNLGVPADELVHVPVGIHHDRYRTTRPLATRPLRVSFCYSAHAQKGSALAVDVVTRVKAAVPAVDVVAFGVVPPEDDLPDWITFVQRPPVEQLVDDIYNTSSVFLCTSNVEGFGLTNVEAMACGAALVTTDNGGSRDYAVHGRTALVAPYGDPRALADHVVTLLGDRDRRIALANAGRDHVLRFAWDRTGALLESFLDRYVADPARYGYGLRAGAT
jgi:glycosyltransferase involved in cell wall biosynthesis